MNSFGYMNVVAIFIFFFRIYFAYVLFCFVCLFINVMIVIFFVFFVYNFFVNVIIVFFVLIIFLIIMYCFFRIVVSFGACVVFVLLFIVLFLYDVYVVYVIIGWLYGWLSFVCSVCCVMYVCCSKLFVNIIVFVVIGMKIENLFICIMMSVVSVLSVFLMVVVLKSMDVMFGLFMGSFVMCGMWLVVFGMWLDIGSEWCVDGCVSVMVIEFVSVEVYDVWIVVNVCGIVYFWVLWCELCVVMDVLLEMFVKRYLDVVIVRCDVEVVEVVVVCENVSVVLFFVFVCDGRCVDVVEGVDVVTVTNKTR